MKTATWVWQHLQGRAEPTLCGVLSHDGRVGRFVYDRSYLSLGEHAVAIDPVALPLQEAEFATTHLGGWFSVLLDASPDAWGKRIIDRNFGAQDQRGYMLHAHGHPVGALTFSAGRDEPPAAAVPTTPQTLAETLELHARVEAGEKLEPEESARLLRDAGIGGARPKSTLLADGQLWLVKGESIHDKADCAPVPITEATLISLASELDIQAPDQRVVRVGGKPVLLVERFDRRAIDGGFARSRYASAQTLFWSAPEIAMYSFNGSYVNLARRLERWARAPSDDIKELYRRLVFNALVGNLDDHDKNHGFVANVRGDFRLAPVFDLTVTATSSKSQLSMVFGSEGSTISMDNLLSECAHFKHSRAQAEEVILRQWQHILSSALERFLAFGSDEARAVRTLSRMPGHRLFPIAN